MGGDQQTASFTNTYRATEVTLEGANQLVKVQKNLTGREWQDTDEFRFTMLSEGNAPAPESTEAVVVDDEDAAANYTVNLSNITFENPGTFTYVIKEDNDTDPIEGIDYSNETHAVTITVADNGTGKLEIQSVQFTQRADVDGNKPAEQPEIKDNTVMFTNNYDATEATTNLNGTKDYTDESGANPNAAGKFTFELKAIGGYATDGSDGGSAQNPTIGAGDVPMPEGADANTHTITIGNNGTTSDDGFAFQTIKYNGNHLNNTYIYEIREVIPNGATNNGDGTWSLNGMTYDGAVHTITVAITDEPNTQGEGMHIVATPSMQPADVKFTNTYDPTDYTLTGEEAIHGTKVLQGREIADNETFYFQLVQTGGPETVLANPEVKTVTKDSGMDFAFSALTFSKVGTYTFTVNEVADDQGTETTNDNGMTYSTNVAKVTIKVKDGGNGALVLDGPIVYENQGSDENDKAVFTNVYKASLNYGAQGEGGINVTKQLLDRPMTANEFTFTITGEGEAADLTTDADKSFQNTGAAADQTITMAKLQSLTFDETDAGKTYTFIVDETEPADGQGLAGVAYDKSQYKVEIEVVDNGNGTMHAVTTVTQTMDKDGNEIADGGKVIVDHANSDAEGYEVPTFGFVNDYNPNSVNMGEDTNNALQVTKKVMGAPSAADYTFTLTAQDTVEGPVANITGLDDNHQTTKTTSGTIAAGGTQTLSFDTLTFTEPGTYTFTVQENQPAADEGWTFDTTARTITVEVTDVNPDYVPGGDEPQYDGNLYIGEVTGNNPTIENSYDHGTVTIGGDAEEALEVEKTVKGWSTDADFHFTFAPVEEEGVDWSAVEYEEGIADKTAVTESFTDGAMHGAEFGEITFTEPGTYKFNVTEDEAHDETADPAGWTYDTGTKTITVTVSETDEYGNYDGQLHATVDGPARFENTYEAGTATVEGGEATFAGTKTIDGRDWLNNETFGFELTKGSVSEGASWDNVTYLAADAAEGTEPSAFDKATATANAGNNGDGTFWFAGKYLFSEPGTYTFNVTETQHNGAALPQDGTNGMTYDRHVGTITVEVTDNGTGTLQTEVTYGADDTENGGGNASVDFVNSYTAAPVTYGLKELLGGTKTVKVNNGSYTIKDGDFGFYMRPLNATDTTYPLPKGNGVTEVEVTEGGATYKAALVYNTNPQPNNTATYDFGEITFDKVGEYTYNIFERDTELPGISYDNARYQVTFKVTDNKQGQLEVDPSAVKIVWGQGDNQPVAMDALSFENTYDSGTVTGSQEILKRLSGRAFNDTDEFVFEITMSAKDANGTIIPFDKLPKPVADASTNISQIVQDGDAYTYTVTVKPTSTGSNPYIVETGTFTYTLPGTYTFHVREQGGGSIVDNITYSNAEYEVVVTIKTVTENGDAVLKRSVTINGEPLASADQLGTLDFTNTYTPDALEIDSGNVEEQVTKTLTGRTPSLQAGEFDFEMVIESVDGSTFDKVTMPEGAEAIKEGETVTGYRLIAGNGEPTDGKANVNFGNIKFDQEGTYQVSISEVVPEPGAPFMKYDNHVYSYQLKVTYDNVKGEYKFERTNVSEEGPAFQNEYQPEEDVKSATVDGADVDGGYVRPGDQITYTIKFVNDAVYTDSDTLPEGAVLGQSAPADVTVTDIVPAGTVFVSADNGVEPDENGQLVWTFKQLAPGYTGELHFTVQVTDAAVTENPITNTASVKVGENEPKVTNEVISYPAGKTVSDENGGSVQVGDVLDYTVSYFNNSNATAKVTVTDKLPDGLTYVTGSASDNGTYDEDNHKLTWTFENVEAGKGGTVTFKAQVNEAALSEGATENTAGFNLNDDPTVNTNTTDVEVKTGSVTISKTVELADAGQGTQIDGNKLFEFTVTLADASNNVLSGTYKLEGAYNANGEALTEIANGDKIYLRHNDTATIAGLPEGATVTVEETAAAGYSTDASKQGTKVAVDNVNGITFVNTYNAKPVTLTGDTALGVTKRVAGMDTTEDFAFTATFDPTRSDGTAAGIKGSTNDAFSVDAKVTADFEIGEGEDYAENSAKFGDITFTAMGTYVFDVSENVPAAIPNGWSYDDHHDSIVVSVTDNGQGQLVAEVAGNYPTFINSYTFPGATFKSLDGIKYFTGKELTNSMFTFLVSPQDGAPMGETMPANFNGDATQVEDGVWSAPITLLKNITFDEAGIYTYIITEVNDGQGGITYDNTQYRVTLTVGADGFIAPKIEQSANGTIWADAASGIVFNNSYEITEDATLDGATALAGTKTLSGRDWTDKDSFTFILEMTEGNEEAVTMPGDLLAVVQGAYSDGAQVPFSFGDIEFSQIGDYTFTIREQQPGEDGFVGQTGGMTYDNHTRTIKVNVFDNGAGKLEAKVVSDEGGSNWTNVYDADTPAELIGATDLAVTKVIDGREWLEGESFTFTLIPGDKETEEAVYGNEAAGIAPTVTMPVGEDASITITSATENHTNSFGNITFTEPGNYSFKIAEEGEDHDGLVYDKDVRTVKVSVTDNLDGTLSAKVVGITPEAGLTFTNKYDTTGDEELDGATNLAVVKNLTGRDWQEGDVFTFQLAAGDGDTASAIKEGKVELSSGDTTEQITVTNEMVTEEGVHTNHFGSIKFHEVGTYTFTVTEQPSTMPGVTNDADADRTVVVSVVDNNAGELVASVVADKSEQLTFTNTYKPGSTTTGEGSVNLSGKKVLNGRDLVAGEFTFLITAGDDATSAAIADGTVVLPVENPVNKADGSFSFGDITFDAAGTYVFNIAEMAPRAASETGTFNGITYDPTVYTVTIEVKDNTVAGKLEVASVTGIPEGGMVFTNTFTPQGQSTAVVPSITKNYTGHDLAAGQGDFAFKVVNNADANDVYNGIVKMTKAGTATVDVEPIYYDADDMAEATMDENGLPTKTFTYTISEVDGGKDGVEYDKATYTMTVVVSVNTDGSFAEPVVSYANAAGDALEGGVVFNNSYSAANPASYRPYGTKATIAQDDTKDNTNLNAMRFSFEVVDAENEIVSVGTSNANGDITFEPIDNLMGEGTHTYTIREVSPDTEGLTMDTTTYTLTLEVADDGAGSFYVVPGSEVYTNNATDATSNGANFTNVYNGGVVPLVLSVTKDLDGRALNAGEFGFTLYDYTGDVKGAPLAYGVNDAEGDVTFGSINYYYDKVVTTPEEGADQADQTEETTDADQAEDQTPDEGEQTGEGTETTTPEMPDASGDGTAADNQPETGTGSVTDEGATDQTGNGEQTGDVSGEGAGTTTPETPDASGEATGDGTTDTGMTDQGATGTTDVPGATEETAPVEETPAATEEVATESEAPSEVATLSNETTNPVADVASFLAPEVAIADDVAAEQYELEPLPETVVVDETAAAESTGATTAEPVEQVVSTDLGWHRYLIEENAGDLGGVSYDQSKFIVDVLVSDKVDENGMPVGEIQATVENITKVDANYANPQPVEVSAGDGMDNVVFYNTYKVTEPSYVTITGTKTLTGRAMTENDKFTFSVYDANGNEVATGISKADGSIDFTSIEVNGAAESTYTVKENHAGETINGVTYSEQVFEFTIKSWDNGNGGWDYEVVYPEGGIAFTNDYSIQGDGILVGFEGTKTLTGRDMKADEFGFAVYDANGEKVAGGQNTAAADGEASALELGKVTITEPGEYEYTIAENAGTAGGVTYDGRTFTAQVKVWDNGMGALEYEVTYPNGPVAFENTYGLEEGAKVEVTPVATKTLTGRALADGEFTFAVTDADGKTVSTGTNDASGNVNFTPITFTETGTYTYTISEVNGRQDTITYDDATFGLVVTIADDGQGGLVAADVNYANGTPAFANVYKEPEKPVDPKPAEPEVPKTGDDGMNLAGAAALGLGGLGAALVGGGALLRRRASR